MKAERLPTRLRTCGRTFTIVDDIRVTGVKSVVEDLKADGPVYDLQGCRVEQMDSRKIYVRGGRKFRQP